MIYLARAAIDVAALMEAVRADEYGAATSFVGLVRDHHDGRAVLRLEYSAYEPMAEAECARIVLETEQRWPVRVALRHRIGELVIGDIAVAIAVGSGHRAAAFEACRHVIETVKQRVPIWKKEFYADGSVEWVDPTRPRSASEVP
ncbi:MAG TPA: molybdenum cofactor biosynthesis protein MoaE [Gemmatimonadales bacterium]|nr:molybdenum cofactor biosynthesis protein MoaE [Gemmatimonadales bacterium]